MQNDNVKCKNAPARRGFRNFDFYIFNFTFAPDGFTLLEVVVSFGIFFAVIVVSIGAVLAISNAQIKASNFQTIQDDLRFSLEFMTKEIRSGTNFTVSSGPACPPICQMISFTHAKSDGTTENIGYCLRNGAISRIFTGASGCDDVNLSKPVTSSEITVGDLKFYVMQGSGLQPRISVVVSAVSNNPKFPSNFRLATTVSQRYRP